MQCCGKPDTAVGDDGGERGGVGGQEREMNVLSRGVDSFVAFVTPTFKPVDTEVLSVNQIRFAVILCLVIVGIDFMAVVRALTATETQWALFAFASVMGLAVTATFVGLKYTRHHLMSCLSTCCIFTGACLLYYIAEVLAGNEVLREIHYFMSPALLNVVVLPKHYVTRMIVTLTIAAGVMMAWAASQLSGTFADFVSLYTVLVFQMACLQCFHMFAQVIIAEYISTEKRQKVFLEGALEGMAVFDMDRRWGDHETVTAEHFGTIVDTNNTFITMFGSRRVKGRKFSDFITMNDDAGEDMSLDNTHTSDNASPTMTFVRLFRGVGRRADGTEFPVSIGVREELTSTTAIRIVALRDMTESERVMRVAAEQQALQQTNTVKAEFLDNITHELRNPIHAIVGSADMLREDQTLSKGSRRKVETIAQTSLALLSIVNQILDFSKLEHEQFEFHDEPCNLVGLIETMITEADAIARGKGLVVTYDCERELNRTYVFDVTRLCQIFRNLIGNAVKFTQQGGIVVTARLCSDLPSESVVEFKVIDTGPGVPQENQEKIFERFQQVAGEAAASGTGLGLAIVSELINRFGGEISLSSVLGEGSTFIFSIPLKKQVDRAVVSQSSAAATEPPLQSRRLIVLEPVKLIRNALVSRLVREGARATGVTSVGDVVSQLAGSGFVYDGVVSLRPISRNTVASIAATIEHQPRFVASAQQFVILCAGTEPGMPLTFPGIVVQIASAPVLTDAMVSAFNELGRDVTTDTLELTAQSISRMSNSVHTNPFNFHSTAPADMATDLRAAVAGGRAHKYAQENVIYGSDTSSHTAHTTPPSRKRWSGGGLDSSSDLFGGNDTVESNKDGVTEADKQFILNFNSGSDHQHAKRPKSGAMPSVSEEGDNSPVWNELNMSGSMSHSRGRKHAKQRTSARSSPPKHLSLDTDSDSDSSVVMSSSEGSFRDSKKWRNSRGASLAGSGGRSRGGGGGVSGDVSTPDIPFTVPFNANDSHSKVAMYTPQSGSEKSHAHRSRGSDRSSDVGFNQMSESSSSSSEFVEPSNLVLIADDGSTNRLLASEMAKMAGYTTECVENGKLALDAVLANPRGYMCVLLDIEMPVMGGVEACKKIREAGLTALPIVAVTGHTSQEAQDEFMAAGMTSVLTKPFNKEDMANLLNGFNA